jgi:entry exclusion lipoprotein TrbK
MNSNIIKLLTIPLVFISIAACDASDFKQPETNEEWKKYCDAPDLLEKLKAINNKEQRENAAGMCSRAPWVEVKKSPEVHW